KKKARKKMYKMRMVTSKNAYQELLDVEKFLSANVNDYIIWGYAKMRKKNSPCDFTAVFNEGNPEKKFYGILEVDGIIHNDDLYFDRDEWEDLFRETGLLNWLDDPDIYSSFYKVVGVLIFPPNSNIGHMDNFRNDKGESLLIPGKIRTGNFIKYVGNEPDILNFLRRKKK
ncbi:MAG: hypothetical protein ACTSVC_06630, partial [Promethearchaeota archaeon]